MMSHIKLILISCLLLIVHVSCETVNSSQQNTEENSNSLIGKIKPKSSSEISGSYWGVQAGSLADSIMEKAAELGVKWTRLHARWEEIEKEKGQFDWQETDEAFEAVLKYGITPFVTLGQGHAMYSGTGSYDDPNLAAIYGDSPAPPVGSEAEMQAWLNFVGQTIERYKDRITYWEIWNEPNHRKYWGAPPNGEDYGRLVKATTEKIRSIQPDAKIVAGSTAGIDANFVDAFLSQTDPQEIDIISFHNYAPLPEDRVYRMQKYLEVINKHNPDLELWQGECGYPSQSRTTGFRGRAPWGLNIQAKWLLRQAFVDTYYCHATLSNYFILAHDGSMDPPRRTTEFTGIDTVFGYPERGGSRVYSDGINEKCILFRETQEPKPAFHAYQNLIAAMDDRYKKFATDYDIEITDQGDFYGIGEHEDAYPSVPLLVSFKTAQDKSFLAYWLPWNPQENIVHPARVNVSVKNISFEEPVLLDLLTGEVFMINGFSTENGRLTLNDLPMTDSPMALVEKSEINFL
jgi:hypothetical protein